MAALGHRVRLVSASSLIGELGSDDMSLFGNGKDKEVAIGGRSLCLPQNNLLPRKLKQGGIVSKSYDDVMPSDAKSEVFEHALVLRQADPLAVIEALIGAYSEEDYYVYEKPVDGCWHIALGIQAGLVLTPTTMTLTHFSRPAVKTALRGGVTDIARRFCHSEGGEGWRVYGQAAFEYAAHVRGVRSGVASTEEKWPLLSLMVPRTEITVNHQSVTIRTRDIDTLTEIQELLAGELRLRADYKVSPVDTESGRDDYLRAAGAVLNEIRSGRCEKVTLSRQVNVPGRMDMLGTYLQARPKHTPSRSYLVKFMEREVLGFSPELVMAVRGRRVSTEPVAGTRALQASDSDKADLRKDLQSDPKEIVEHAISVREAFREMELFSQNVKVDEFMSTLERGSVQHIASEVTGTLRDGKDAWDAFDVLFPSITASGIPKTASIEAILRMEDESRGLYSGAILMVGENEFEACLVLRSAFQESGKSWIQAGCGMIGLSTPEREFTETIEKFAGIAPYVVCEN